jgi:membrane protease subunit HflC
MMKGLRLPILGILAIIVLGIIYTATFVVTERNQAVVLRFGEIQRVIVEPGLYFKIPTNFVDTVQLIDRRLLTVHLTNKRVQVSDSRRYLVDAFATYRISDAQKFVESVSGNIGIVETRLEPRLESALRRVYGQREFNAALSEQRAEMMREVRDQLRPQALELGLDIVDVRVQRTDLLPEVSQQAFERMRSERLAEAANLRALGTQEALRIRAEADRKAVVTVAEAQRDSEIMRGEGEGERNRLFADAFSRDPDFFEFYRTMKAYETAISGTGTTMVLSPDSDFFKYFGTDNPALNAAKTPTSDGAASTE